MADAPAPTSPFPVGDPRTATYNDELATLQHQRETSISGARVEKGQAQENYRFGLSQYNQAEPRALSTEQNTANTQGLAESGINAQRRGTVLSDYVNKKTTLGTTEQRALARAAEKENQAQINYGLGVKTAADRSLEKYRAEQIALSPNEVQPAAPRTPAPVQLPRIIGGGPQPTTGAVRKAAARKAVKR